MYLQKESLLIILYDVVNELFELHIKQMNKRDLFRNDALIIIIQIFILSINALSNATFWLFKL